jgi:cleavage and polyadenylation specificity factor subunit 2
MLNGKIAFSAGSTVPILETSTAVLPPVRESKTEEPAAHEHIPSVPAPDVEGDEPFIKTEPAGEPETLLPDPTQVAEEVKPMLPLPLPSSLFVGDLRLAALKARLAAKSIPAEFAGEGVLICGPGVSLERAEGDDLKGGSIVAVRKLAEGSIVLEGSVGKVYFDVRRELYGGLAQVATA